MWIDFNKPKIGQICRKKALKTNGIMQVLIKNGHQLKKIMSREFEYTPNNDFKLKVKRKKFPLQMAASRTINKEQSQTRTVRGVLDFECKHKIAALHYTGLSRFNKKENVVILNLNEEKIHTHPDVIKEMERLRKKENSVKLSYKPVYSMPNDTVKIVFPEYRNIAKVSEYH